MMHELQCYMKGHRLPLVMLLATMSYALSMIGGSTILPLPPIFWSVAPPITVDSALALMITAAVGIFATASLSAWENQSAQPWWIADMVVVMFLVAPSLLVSLGIYPESRYSPEPVRVPDPIFPTGCDLERECRYYYVGHVDGGAERNIPV